MEKGGSRTKLRGRLFGVLLIGLAVGIVIIHQDKLDRQDKTDGIKQAEILAALYNTGIAAAFNSLAEAESKEQAVTLLLAGAEGTSCWGPDRWPPPDFRSPSADRIKLAMPFLVFETHVNPNSVPIETYRMLKVRGTEIDWLRSEG